MLDVKCEARSTHQMLSLNLPLDDEANAKFNVVKTLSGDAAGVNGLSKSWAFEILSCIQLQHGRKTKFCCYHGD